MLACGPGLARLTLLRPLCWRAASSSGLWFKEGDTAALTDCFTAAEVRAFAALCGDANPVHLDPDFAKRTRFQRCIVHGILVNGLVSAVLGTKLPGPGTIVLSQMCEFPAPLFVGEPVTAQITVVSIDRRLVTCSASCLATDRNEVVLSGSVRLLAPRRKPDLQES